MIPFMCETVCRVLALFLSVISPLLILIQALTLLSSTLEESNIVKYFTIYIYIVQYSTVQYFTTATSLCKLRENYRIY